MFCDKDNINILTSLLVTHRIADAVVCPGSRNGTIVHNLHALHTLRLHPVTDERSAGFVALGIAQATKTPVLVCVTSGSALLNLLPAVTEAFYQHIPIIVVSADRPADLIGQLDGQTIIQNGALWPYARTFTIVEPYNENSRRFANREVNEALLQAWKGKCVHLNIPVSEPLFSFRTASLPNERAIKVLTLEETLDKVQRARLPLLVCGQMNGVQASLADQVETGNSILVLPELIANIGNGFRMAAIEQKGWPKELMSPDLVVHAGGNLIHKQLKQFLRRQHELEVIRVTPYDEMPDPFFHLQAICTCTETDLFEKLAELDENVCVKQIKSAFPQPEHTGTEEEKVVTALYETLTETAVGSLHLANSSAVRLAARFFSGYSYPVLCNRGTNGIEGSLSTTVGYAVASPGKLAVCLIGDLSFFYDQNALWNTFLPANLRIVLLNNGGGKIFDQLPGLSDSPAKDTYIKAMHKTTARGICEAYGVNYLSVDSNGNYVEAYRTLFSSVRERAALLEILI